MSKERRNFPRVPQPFEARFRLAGELDFSWHAITLINLSAGGVRFRTHEPAEKGALVEVQVHLPGMREPMVLNGRVVWSSMQASGVAESGVELLDATPELQMQIDSIVRFLRGTTPPTEPPAS